MSSPNLKAPLLTPSVTGSPQHDAMMDDGFHVPLKQRDKSNKEKKKQMSGNKELAMTSQENLFPSSNTSYRRNNSAKSLQSFESPMGGFGRPQPGWRIYHKKFKWVERLIIALGLWAPKKSSLILKYIYPLFIVCLILYPWVLYFDKTAYRDMSPFDFFTLHLCGILCYFCARIYFFHG